MTFIYICCFIFSFVLTIIINRVLLAFARNLGTRGSEQIQVRWASTNKPSLGGLSFFVIFLFLICIIGFFDFEYVFFSKKQLFGVFAGITIAFAIGFADDTYNTNPKLKFFGQILCGLTLYFFDIKSNFFSAYIGLDLFFTIFWVVGLMNSINMLDNMDGVTASVSIFILSFFFILFNIQHLQDFNISLLTIGIIGSLVGFLYHNWYPAKMYMGDAGSQFLGLLLAIYPLQFIWEPKFSNSLNITFIDGITTSILIFIIPIIDTSTVIYQRLKAGKSPFIGGADHITHHLVFFGFGEIQVICFFIIIFSVSCLVLILKLTGKIFGNILPIVYFLIVNVGISYFYYKGALSKTNKSTVKNPRKSLFNLIFSSRKFQ